MQWSWTIRTEYLHIPHWSDIQTSIFFLPLPIIFQPLSQLELTIILNITVYATSLCKWWGQFQRPSGSSFSMKMKMSFCFFYAIYYFPAYTILNAIFLEQKNHTHLKWRCWISTLGIFLSGWKRLYLHWIRIAIGFHLQPIYPKQMSLFLCYA